VLLTDLDQFKTGGFPPGYPANLRTFYSPVDDVSGVLAAVVGSTQHTLIITMFGYDDDQLDAAIQELLRVPSVYVQISLDKTQAGGKHESELLAKYQNQEIGNSISIGTSESHHQIQHMKMVAVDGLFTITGSTNWSTSGESEQDNQLTVIFDSLVTAEFVARASIIHDFQLKQMAAAAVQPPSE
jgi:phosphatidylserine/phosphatidylglycerophosphate/cardiolipin synthase-like enzyme